MGQEDEVLSAMGCAFATVSPQQGQASHTDTHEHDHLNLPLKFGSFFFFGNNLLEQTIDMYVWV